MRHGASACARARHCCCSFRSLVAHHVAATATPRPARHGTPRTARARSATRRLSALPREGVKLKEGRSRVVSPVSLCVVVGGLPRPDTAQLPRGRHRTRAPLPPPPPASTPSVEGAGGPPRVRRAHGPPRAAHKPRRQIGAGAGGGQRVAGCVPSGGWPLVKRWVGGGWRRGRGGGSARTAPRRPRVRGRTREAAGGRARVARGSAALAAPASNGGRASEGWRVCVCGGAWRGGVKLKSMHVGVGVGASRGAACARAGGCAHPPRARNEERARSSALARAGPPLQGGLRAAGGKQQGAALTRGCSYASRASAPLRRGRVGLRRVAAPPPHRPHVAASA